MVAMSLTGPIPLLMYSRPVGVACAKRRGERSAANAGVRGGAAH